VFLSLSHDTNRLRHRFANGQRNSTFVSTTIASWETARRATTLEAEDIGSEEISLFATEVGTIFRACPFSTVSPAGSNPVLRISTCPRGNV